MENMINQEKLNVIENINLIARRNTNSLEHVKLLLESRKEAASVFLATQKESVKKNIIEFIMMCNEDIKKALGIF